MMNPRRGSIPELQVRARKPYSGLSVLFKSLVATLVLGSAVGTAQYFIAGGTLWFLHKSGDVVDVTTAQERAAAFATLEPLRLSLVPAKDTETAIDGMGLDAVGKVAMMMAAQNAAQDEKTPDPVAPVTAAPVSKSQPAQNRLAWITLWDTDAEDGDAVRIDSQGYSRTVILAKQPVTFAVPVPGDGVINLTGVRDGEGGGITVGLASGASRAIFPIMSLGQTLGLRVRFD